MPKITIPKESHKALLHFARMPEDAFEGLMHAVQGMEPGHSGLKFRQALADKVNSAEPEILRPVINELFQMEKTRVRLSLTAVELSEVVAEAAKSIDDITNDDRECLKARIVKFDLYRQPVALTYKTEEVLTDHNQVFLNARIMTDVRPVFDDSADSISASVIVHNLVIHYGENGVHKDFFVALDTTDIPKLEAVIARAKKKEELLLNLIKKTEVKYIP